MKTYAEKQGEETINWHEFLKRENITEEEWSDADDLAESWVTCACGNQCYIIPRDSAGEPLDKDLAYLGGLSGFLGAIKKQNRESALEVLDKIEARSAILIQEEIKRMKQELAEIESELNRND